MADSAACLVYCRRESAAKKKSRKIRRGTLWKAACASVPMKSIVTRMEVSTSLAVAQWVLRSRATDTSLQRKVALKIIKTDIAQSSADARERFMREARAAAAIRHENVATIHQFGMRLETGQYFYAMELIEGETLEQRVRRAGPLDARATVAIAQQVTSALAAAEKRGLVHRDLKPANLMLLNADDVEVVGASRHALPTVKLIDFGLAKAIHTQTDPKSLTHDRFVFWYSAFASPEQFEHSALDVRSDIYSLGATLWFALTGKTPFSGPKPRWRRSTALKNRMRCLSNNSKRRMSPLA